MPKNNDPFLKTVNLVSCMWNEKKGLNHTHGNTSKKSIIKKLRQSLKELSESIPEMELEISMLETLHKLR